MSANKSDRLELVVATAHDIDLETPQGGRRYTYAVPSTPEDSPDYARIVRASEASDPLGVLQINVGNKRRAQVPFYEFNCRGLRQEPEIRSLVGGLAANQLLVVSRFGGRYLRQADMAGKDFFGHPAQIVRDLRTRQLIAARCIGIPQPVRYRGVDGLTPLLANRPFYGAYRIVNCLPETMRLQLEDGSLISLPRRRVRESTDVEYAYTKLRKTTDGIAVAESRPKAVVGLPLHMEPDQLWLVHSEVLIEALRLGAVTPEQASRMVVATGIQRDKANRQTNVFTRLATFGLGTLHEIYNDIQI